MTRDFCPLFRGAPTTQNQLFLTHRTTHSGKISGAGGAFLENFRDFSENCFLKMKSKVNFGGFWGSNFRNFKILLKTAYLVFYGRFHPNSSKSFHLRPFWSAKHWFFENIFENFSNFWPIFQEKFGPIE